MRNFLNFPVYVRSNNEIFENLKMQLFVELNEVSPKSLKTYGKNTNTDESGTFHKELRKELSPLKKSSIFTSVDPS